MIFSFNKNLLLSTIVASVSIATISPAYAETNVKAKAMVQTNYDKINAAFVRKDIKGATSLFTQDYVSISPEGTKQTLEEFQTHYDNLFNRFNI